VADHLHAVTRLLTRARRRQILHIVIEQAGVTIAVAFAGFVLLLVLGTQVLDWYWLAALLVGSVGFGTWRTLHRIPSPYRLARIIDYRLNLSDTISTALCFAGEPGGAAAVVRDQAEQAASEADLREALPFRWPKALYAAAGVALVAFGMFAVRYGLTRSLDLRPSLVKMAYDAFANAPNAESANQAPLERIANVLKKELGLNQGRPDTPPGQPQEGPDSSASTDPADPQSAQSGDSARSEMPRTPNPHHQPTRMIDNGKKGNQTGLLRNQPPNGGPNDPGESSAQRDLKHTAPDRGDRSSMLDRMRNAMASLLDKLKSRPSSGDSGRQDSNDGQSQSAQQNQRTAQNNVPGRPGKRNADPQNQAPAASNASQQLAQGNASGKNAGDKAPQQANSGIGRKNGDKSAREAEQMAAMGKITQIFGRRSQDLTGEVMVDVPPGNQQLRTGYTGRSAEHTDSGGEISRDEVPLIYQQYVRQYFEQVRKMK
jgi:hypothetical protein